MSAQGPGIVVFLHISDNVCLDQNRGLSLALPELPTAALCDCCV